MTGGTDEVLYEVADHVATITLNRPDRMNAISMRMLDQLASRLAEADSTGLVYEFIPGADSEIYVYCVYVDAAGEPSPGITVRKLRQNPPFIGGARAATIAPPEPTLREATVELLRRAGLEMTDDPLREARALYERFRSIHFFEQRG